MAKPPQPIAALIERYGPHLNYVPPRGWRDRDVVRLAGKDTCATARGGGAGMLVTSCPSFNCTRLLV